MVLGYPPAGPVDIIARIVADRLSQIWGQPVVVDNVSGAGGNIGGDRVAKSTPDGYTILMATNAQIAINPGLYAKMTYDPAKDLMPISQAVYSPNILVVPNDVPAKSVQELVAYARANPGKLSFASAGVGTTQHLAGELFKAMAHIDIQHVPYRGAGPMITDLLGGRITMAFIAIAPTIPLVREGKVARARRHIGQALRGGARAADHDRSRLSRLCVDPLDRPDGAGRNPARDHRKNSPGLGESPVHAGDAQKVERHRHGSDRQLA